MKGLRSISRITDQGLLQTAAASAGAPGVPSQDIAEQEQGHRQAEGHTQQRPVLNALACDGHT